MRLVANARKGFATNSSSSHSIILCDDMSKLPNSPEQDEFGWGWFTQKTADEKRAYFRTMAFLHYCSMVGQSEAAILAQSVFPGPLDPENTYIDHQSMPEIPAPVLRGQEMSAFWRWIDRNLVANPRVAVIGGNDNDDTPSWAKDHKKPTLPWGKKFKISADGTFTVFSSWGKLRSHNDAGAASRSSEYPDLVDIKITDYCAHGRDFCYQDSNRDGKHASVKRIREFARDAAKYLGVFEFAIGGGDPLAHPQFAEILRAIADTGIVPNFSCRDPMPIYGDNDLGRAVRETCGAVAVSTSDPDTVRGFSAMQKMRYPIPAGYIHYVVGGESMDNLRAMLKVCRETWTPIILLGWKEKGRATTQPHDSTGWWDVVRAETGRGLTVGVDSFLIPDVEAHMQDVPVERYERGDGNFSFYVDAVAGKAAKHSAVSNSEMVDIMQNRGKSWEHMIMASKIWEQVRT